MMVERWRAVMTAAEQLPTDKQERLAQSLEELIDALQWEAFFGSVAGQDLIQKVAEEGEQHLQTGDVEEIKDH
jgi:hypothetical protein